MEHVLSEEKCYFRKTSGRASVRKIITICNKKITYQRLHGPPSVMKLGKTGICSLMRFRCWMHGEISEQSDFEALDGVKQQPTFLVHDVQGDPLFRCSQKRAEFYLRRGFAKEIDQHTLQLTEAGKPTEDILKRVYGNSLNKHPFFMAVKNDKCVCCGKAVNLTRHHIIPKRHKKKLPHIVRACLSNVLFVCTGCHAQYERFSEQEPNNNISDPIKLAKAWRDHFIDVMQPQFIPTGWDILTSDPKEKAALFL